MTTEISVMYGSEKVNSLSVYNYSHENKIKSFLKRYKNYSKPTHAFKYVQPLRYRKCLDDVTRCRIPEAPKNTKAELKND